METVVPLRSPEAHALPASAPLLDPRRAERIARLARRLAQAIADTADADQVAITVPGVESLGSGTLPELLPRQWLVALNDGKPGIYRIAIQLCANGQKLGTLRLATVRPNGFQPDEVARAQMDAYHASEMLAAALSCDWANPAATQPDGVVDLEEVRAALAEAPALTALAS
jgi:hypothetical protein